MNKYKVASYIIILLGTIFISNTVAEAQQWHLQKIRASDAWAISDGSYDIVVTIIDSGIPMSYPGKFLLHSDLSDYSRITLGNNYSDFGASDNVHDTTLAGHGTMIAGIVGASGSITGIDKKCTMRIDKMFHLGEEISGSTLSDAIDETISDEPDLRIINLSLKVNKAADTTDVINTIDNNSDILFVCAAGNDGQNNVRFPASLAYSRSNVIAVAASDSNDARPTYSNFGVEITCAAPGGKTATERPLDYDPSPGGNIYSSFPNDDYRYWAGTSFATPMVTGVASLILAVNPGLSPNDVKNIIINSCEKVGQYSYGDDGRNDYFGYGRVNAYGALVLARGWGNIDYHQVWAKDMKIVGKKAGDSPTLKDSLSVAKNDTLTILPDVTITWVKNQSYWHKLLARGTLIAVGEEDHPIIFQTTADGQSLDNAWGGITIFKTRSDVQHCKLENSIFGLLFAGGIAPSIEHNKMYKCAYGLYYGSPGMSTAKYNRMDYCTIGSRAKGASTYYERNDFTHSSWYGLQFQDYAQPRLERNKIESNYYGFRNESGSTVWMDSLYGIYPQGLLGHNSVVLNNYKDIASYGGNIYAEYNWWGDDGEPSYVGDGSKIKADSALGALPNPVGSDLPGNFRVTQRKRPVNDLIAAGDITTVEEFLSNVSTLMTSQAGRPELAAYCEEIANYHMNNKSIYYTAKEMYYVFLQNSDNLDQVIAGYNDLLAHDIDDDMRSRVLLRAGEIYLIQLSDMDSALLYFNDLFKNYPDNEQTMLAHLDIGQSDKAHEIFNRLHSNVTEEPTIETSIGQNYPNPFNPETTIRFSLPQDTRTEMRIYNIQGRLVKTLIDKKLPAGAHRVVWYGRDNRGSQVPTGVYFMRFSAGEVTQTRKMVLVK